MNTGESGIALLKWIEKLRLLPYDDQTGKKITAWCKGATTGYGYLIPIGEWSKYKDGITQEQAESLLLETLTPFEDAISSLVKIRLHQNEFDALILLIYNIGIQQFSASSLLRMLNDPNIITKFSSIEKAWKAFNKSQGRVNQGLINRRNAEWDIYSVGLYNTW